MNASPEFSFRGMAVAAFESRRAIDMSHMIEKFGGSAYVSPSMREVPITDHGEAIDFANRLITGQIDVVIVMTGVGFLHLLDAIDRKVDRQRFLDALSDCVTIARGPKPAAKLREQGISATFRVPEPNTWRELLALIDAQIPIGGQRIALQEYGVTNPGLVAGLEARGAQVLRVKVYKWGLPEDTEPLARNIERLSNKDVDVAMFTSAHQLVNLFMLATKLKQLQGVKAGLRQAIVASIGPTTSEALNDHGIAVDFEPSHPKMGHLVSECAEQIDRLLAGKSRVEIKSASANVVSNATNPARDGPFLKACHLEPTESVPIWLMRQAGRYLPEYRRIREKTTFLELCKQPALCAEIMIRTVERLGVDAAIIFSDLLPILEPMGFQLEYAQGEGPVIHNPLRDPAAIDGVLELESLDPLAFVFETVKQTKDGLPPHLPVIGFAGAPFTLASYAIEGGSSRSCARTKTLMRQDPGAWKALMEKLARAVTRYLNAQISAGAHCVQLFDSWAGCLGTRDYATYVLPHVQHIIDGISPGIPLINFATGNPALLPLLADTNAAVVGVDWRIPLDQAWQAVGAGKAIQGNLDPTLLFAPQKELLRGAAAILRQAAGQPGHIFNLGHGVLPDTPVDNVLALIDFVHERKE